MVEKVGNRDKPAPNPPSVGKRIIETLKSMGKAYVNCFPKKDPLLEIRPPF